LPCDYSVDVHPDTLAVDGVTAKIRAAAFCAVIALLIVAALLPVKASTTYFVTFQSRDGRLRSICRFEGFEFADE
jgi:hypothetical protein